MFDKAMNARIIEARKAAEHEPKSKSNNDPSLPEDKNPGLTVKAVKRRKLEDILINREIESSFSLDMKSLV